MKGTKGNRRLEGTCSRLDQDDHVSYLADSLTSFFDESHRQTNSLAEEDDEDKEDSEKDAEAEGDHNPSVS